MGVTEWSLYEYQLVLAFSTTCVILATLLLVAPLVLHGSPPHKRSALSDGDGESIQAFQGFYGNPLYRPYGFGAWGWGSEGFGYNTLVTKQNVYGGYYFPG